jgi:nucleotide-binding universal stress UspA family protein
VTKTIVVGVDGSRCSEAALDHAIGLAQAFGDRLAVVYAVEPPGRSAGEEWVEHRRALEELGAPIVESAAVRARAAGVDAEPVLAPRRPVEALLEESGRRDARFLVVGTASERPLTGVILGSVPHKLLHRSVVPVVVVPAPDEG